MSIYGLFDMARQKLRYYNRYEDALTAFQSANGSTGIILFVAGQSSTKILLRK
ncbi:MAG: hypothetical protein ACOCVU_01175 [Desulfohalobiaceae bacterium]